MARGAPLTVVNIYDRARFCLLVVLDHFPSLLVLLVKTRSACWHKVSTPAQGMLFDSSESGRSRGLAVLGSESGFHVLRLHLNVGFFVFQNRTESESERVGIGRVGFRVGISSAIMFSWTPRHYKEQTKPNKSVYGAEPFSHTAGTVETIVVSC